MKNSKREVELVPASDFAARYRELLEGIAAGGKPVALTDVGRFVGVILSIAEYERLVEENRVLRAIGDGLCDLAAGRFVDHETVMAEARARIESARREREKREENDETSSDSTSVDAPREPPMW